MLGVEELLNDLHGLEKTLNTMGVHAKLEERYDEMPYFDFRTFEGGLDHDGNGFRFVIRAYKSDNVYSALTYPEFRHELMRRLAEKYEHEVTETLNEWRRLSGDDTPMPANLTKANERRSAVAARLRSAIAKDDVPMLLSDEDFKTLSRHRPPATVQPEEASERLQGIGLLRRRYYIDQVFDVLTDKGRAAVEYTARVTGRSLPRDFAA